MKKHFSIICVLAALLSSCGIVDYVGIDPNPAPTSGENTRLVGTYTTGSPKEVYVFGIGGSGSHESAIRQAIEKANLQDGEELVNMTCVSHTRFIPFTWLPIVVIRNYTVTADKISHNMTAPVVNEIVADSIAAEASETEEMPLKTAEFMIPESEFAPNASTRLANLNKEAKKVHSKFEQWKMLKSGIYTSYTEVYEYLYVRPNEMNLTTLERITTYMNETIYTTAISSKLKSAKSTEAKIRVFLEQAE